MAELADHSPVFVRAVLPGETVRARPTAKRGDGWAAEPDEVLAQSDERTAAPCVHFPACGGCALQHWRMAPYLAWKSSLLDAALRRAGHAPALGPIQATPPYARRRMDFAVRREGRRVLLGLHRPRSDDIVDLTECHVLHPALAGLIAPLRTMLGGIGALRREGSLIANLLGGEPDLLLRTDGDLSTADRTRLAVFATAQGVPRIAWARGAGGAEIACQLHAPQARFGAVAVTPPPGAFLQASEPGEVALVEAVLHGLPRLTARSRVADLYAGVGTFTLALAAHARVAAYEGDAASVAALRAGVNAAGLAGRVEAHHRDLARQPLSAKELSAFAAMVLDPPHAGAPAQLGGVAASGIARVIYVSCNPAALARDAAVLHAAGYKLLSAVPVDQFLWSARLEGVAVFAR